MSVGTEWLIDAEGCSSSLLSDIKTVQSLCDEVIATLALNVIGEALWHQFPHPGGLTGIYLLSESHLACHTYPEAGIATFNLYCCRARQSFQWEDRLRRSLKASSVTVRALQRGCDSLVQIITDKPQAMNAGEARDNERG